MRTRAAVAVLALFVTSGAAACGTDVSDHPARAPAPSAAPDGLPEARDTPTSRPTVDGDPFASPTAEVSPAPVPTPVDAARSGDPPELTDGTEWGAIPTKKKVVALTFDGGANADGVSSILATLDELNARGTFFLTGRWVEFYPNESASIADAYPIGNHTYSHPHLPQLKRKRVVTEVEDAEAAIVAATGEDPTPLFRFPYGDSDSRTLGIVNELGYGSIRWTVDTLGWKGSEETTVKQVIRRVLDGLGPGAIVLMHVGSAPDGSTLDADALPKLIAKIRARGYKLVGLRRFVG